MAIEVAVNVPASSVVDAPKVPPPNCSTRTPSPSVPTASSSAGSASRLPSATAVVFSAAPKVDTVKTPAPLLR